MSNFFKSAKKAVRRVRKQHSTQLVSRGMPKKAFKKAIKRGKKKAKTLLGQALIESLSDAVMSERAFKPEEGETDDWH
jgi:hypothetical protein